jgi:TolB-like protein
MRQEPCRRLRLPCCRSDRSIPTGADAHLGVGIADAIVTKLANVQSIRVRPTSAIVSLEGRTIDAVAVAHQLQVDHVLTGTVRRAGDAYRFNLQLIRATDDVLVWGKQIDINQRSLFTIEDQVTAEVVAALELQISKTERDRLSRASTQNPDAYGEYLQGRALLADLSDSNLREAMNHFERALQIDPGYALADAGLATAAGTFSVRFAYEQQAADWGRRAEEYASRALKRDANLAEAHLALASAAGTLYRNFDWPTVIREAQVALTLNPNLDLAHSALARALYHVGLLDWSEIESKRAEEVSGGTNIEVGRVHVYNQLLGGHFAEARQMAEALDKKTNVPVIRQYLGLASFYLGDRAMAQDILADVRRPDGRPDTRSQASLAGVLAANGRRDEADKTIRVVLDSGYMDHHVAYALGAAEAQLKRPADAVKWLRAAAETGFSVYQWIERDSLIDPIRSDPGFQNFFTALRADYERSGRGTSRSREYPRPQFPKFTRAPSITRLGFMNTVGCPKFEAKRLSVVSASSAVSSSRLSTSINSSIRLAPPTRSALETRRSTSDCDESRRDPGGSRRMR